MPPIKLTEYSHGAGCGCKISPTVLARILHTEKTLPSDSNLLVGNESNDDAAVYDIGNGMGIISTTDFFMPIVDDPFTFGRIAATNAISDVYAMGGRPLMAVAILGWPINSLSAEVAAQVIDGGRLACQNAGISLAGGHSIDSPEPIFGLAVTGQVSLDQLKRNDQATAGSRLYLTKPLGIGVLSTAQKKGILKPEHQNIAPELMCQLNKFGKIAAKLKGVTAMTDVTGFGLAGHLLEICKGSQLHAKIAFSKVPVIPEVTEYIELGAMPGGTGRNREAYQEDIAGLQEAHCPILFDPQTSGGLLIAVKPEDEAALLKLAKKACQPLYYIGDLLPDSNDAGSKILNIIS